MSAPARTRILLIDPNGAFHSVFSRMVNDAPGKRLVADCVVSAPDGAARLERDEYDVCFISRLSTGCSDPALMQRLQLIGQRVPVLTLSGEDAGAKFGKASLPEGPDTDERIDKRDLTARYVASLVRYALAHASAMKARKVTSAKMERFVATCRGMLGETSADARADL